MPSSILVFGRDQMLMRTRQHIFQRAGYICQAADTQQDLHRFFAGYAIDVLVICHSVTAADCEQARQLAHIQTDTTLVLLLSRSAQTWKTDAADASFETSEGPEQLLRALSALLEHHPAGRHESRSKEPLPALLHRLSLEGEAALNFVKESN